MPLTDARIRTAKPSEKVQKLSDGNGLQLHIFPNGSKIWRLAYRHLGKQRQIAFGPYPGVQLAEARDRREAARKLLRDGIDPSAQRKADRLAAAASAASTFGVIADELEAKKKAEGKAPRTLQKTTYLLGLARGELADRPMRLITAPEVLDVLRQIEKRGTVASAHRLRSLIGEVFRYAVATGRAEVDPTFALKGALLAPIVKHRAAVTDRKALGELLRAIDGFDGQPVTRAALQLQAMLFPRPGELRLAEWTEVDFDDAVWTIPAGRMKMRRPHAVPLPRAAIDILRGLHTITGRGALIFPGVRSSKRPISDNTLNAALRRMGFSQDEVTAHGMRATASTLLNEAGLFSRDAIERALAHVEENEVRRAYARGEHWTERVRMMSWWSEELDRLRAGGKVLPMARAAG